MSYQKLGGYSLRLERRSAFSVHGKVVAVVDDAVAAVACAATCVGGEGATSLSIIEGTSEPRDELTVRSFSLWMISSREESRSESSVSVFVVISNSFDMLLMHTVGSLSFFHFELFIFRFWNSCCTCRYDNGTGTSTGV